MTRPPADHRHNWLTTGLSIVRLARNTIDIFRKTTLTNKCIMFITIYKYFYYFIYLFKQPTLAADHRRPNIIIQARSGNKLVIR